jgi:hypothetical protein
MYPRLLGPLVSFWGNILLGVSVATWEVTCGEPVDTLRRWSVRRNLGCRFRNDPLSPSARYFVGADFHKSTSFDGEEMTGREHFDVHNGQYPMIIVMIMDLSRNDFLADFVDILTDSLMHNG